MRSVFCVNCNAKPKVSASHPENLLEKI